MLKPVKAGTELAGAIKAKLKKTDGTTDTKIDDQYAGHRQAVDNEAQAFESMGMGAESPDAITNPSRLLSAPRQSTPELDKAPIVSDIIPAGTKFNQAVSPGQKSPGAFVTTDEIPDVDYVRNRLSVTPGFKEEVSGVREVEIVRDVRGQTSTVGPQNYNGITYEGGGAQTQILEYDPDNPFVKFVGDEQPLE